MDLFKIGNTEVPVSIKANNRLKSRRLSVDSQGVLVEAPDALLAEVRPFLEAKATWIFNEWKKHEGKSKQSPWPEAFTSGAKVLYLGRYRPIDVTEGGRSLLITEHAHQFDVRCPSNLTQDQKNIIIKTELIDLFSEMIHTMTQEFASYHGFPPQKVRITRRKDRWAHCAADNTIAVGWDLVFLPKPVIEYVIVHELIHTKIKNHGQAFWNEVGSHLPSWRELERALRDFEQEYDIER